MHHLEGFHYTNTLDLNMGYYTIIISPDSQYITTIITEFGKIKYNRLSMGMSTSVDIFQSKADDLFGDIKVIKTYIDDILVLSK